ncbi:N-acetylmuramic acid 6-phosphate etherase [Chitinophaga sp. GCM10012297]|uniref:N-acetylmuramic acid 6-phosphate etherase n=1 Tax=Chitinophaga chungangae TaxID=2821488 RepID=A0ABS3YG03_9BACT|nr:N-acetylmuramic acid 6-phosphate etherase [Chitinophaga chungangae]MBO9153611.1 N-acetylmuramic acid 6-phosphate etherase [Chitinophaga chungangae]
MNMLKVTEEPSRYRHLEKMTIEEITASINQEDQLVALAVEKALPRLNQLIGAAVGKLRQSGRLFYLGAGSGGRLSVLDVIEMPTTYGVPKGMLNAVLAGGTDHLVEALEEKEDDTEDAWKQLQELQIGKGDIVIGISASGTTPFVLAGLQACRRHGITTGCIVSNPGSPIAAEADFPVEVITGPEFVSGSTRMKCGTAQKMIFDMISTTTMIQLGRVEDNRMVNVALINNKIIDRAVKMLMSKAGITDYENAKELLIAHGSVRKALDHLSERI